MGRKSIALALLVFFLGAAGLTAEARNHESFSASSYYANEKPLVTPTHASSYYANEKPLVTPTHAKEPTATTADPNERYPDGYPTMEHQYNPVTEKYEEQPTTTTEKDTFPTSTETTVEAAGTIPKRYEAGYTYGHGTHAASYTGSAQNTDPLTFDPEKGRYQLGYHPYSSYSPKKTATGTTSNPTGGFSLAAQSSYQQTTTHDSDFAHRYEKGYYPSSDYTQQGLTQQQPKPVTSYSSYMANFESLPYPSSGVPFVASGAGCRTAYWAENPAMWPSFLTVKSTVGDAFGSQATATFGQTTMLQALLKYGSDPYSQIVKSGCTALLNSYTRGAYRLSHMKVIEQFNAALVSKEAAAAQALAFETDNVESISAGSACT